MGKIYNLIIFFLNLVLYCITKNKLEIKNGSVSLWNIDMEQQESQLSLGNISMILFHRAFWYIENYF